MVLRPVGDADRAFLVALYRSTREHELAQLAWDEAEKAAFIEHQFSAQDAHYRRHYDNATFDVIEVGRAPAGRLLVHRGARDIRIMDIALLPAFRGRGIGGALLTALRDEAAASSRKLSIHVEENNPARRLYERLGLRVVAAPRPPYLRMEWEPAV